MADLQLCTQYFQAHQNPLGTNDKGFRWAMGGRGITMFNTIVPPNSQLYAWGGCRLDCNACGFAFGQYSNATSNHPGGVNVMMADGSVRFMKSSINLQNWWCSGPETATRSPRRIAIDRARFLAFAALGLVRRDGARATRASLFLLLVPLLPDLTAGRVRAEQDLDLGVGLVGLVGPQVTLESDRASNNSGLTPSALRQAATAPGQSPDWRQALASAR